MIGDCGGAARGAKCLTAGCMTPIAALNEDHHVHSTFSDGVSTLGVSTLEENLAAAERLALVRLRFVDHVGKDSAWLPPYVARIRKLRSGTDVKLSAGVETEILDTDGRLDLPDDLAGVDAIYIADHEFPWYNGLRLQQYVKEWLEAGVETSEHCLGTLIESTVNAMEQHHHEHRLVLAHPLSILPKIGLDERHLSDLQLERLAGAAARTGTAIEINERWRCPSLWTARAFRHAGARIVCSTASHEVGTIGRYHFVAGTVARMG